MKKFFLLFACLLCFGCSGGKDLKPKILVTIPPYAGLVKSLVGDQVDVEIFVLPGSNPHTYEPTPDQIKRFTQAKIWFRIGDPIENRMTQLLEQKGVVIVDLSKNWHLLTGPAHKHGDVVHEENDLHLWMNPAIVSKQVEVITQTLSVEFPEMSTAFMNNYLDLKTKLIKLDAEISEKTAPFKGSYLLVSHPALGYYCERYELHQLSVEVEGKDPLPQDIAQLMNELQEHPVPVVLIEPQYNKKGALLIAEKLHVPHEEINPYSEDYFGMLNHLTDVLVKYYGHTSS
jgi:zinc transport system substrate-binding protein